MAALTRIIPGILAAAAAIGLTGCALRAKTPPATAAAPKPAAPVPAPAPVPLSTPQTQVDLPKYQPIDSAATETVPPPPVEPPVASRPPAPPQRRTVRAETPAPAAVTPEPARPEFQEIIPAADLKRLQDSAQSRKREVTHILEVLSKRRLSVSQRNDLASIKSFLAQSDEYEKKNEMRMADLLAEKAQILARNLLNGR
jgi:hypothetical protein